jgi:isopenicillin N synthase-like dioxygenase
MTLIETTQRTDEIPVIDIEPHLKGDANSKRRVADSVRQGAEDTGFLYIRNHGVDQKIIDSAFEASKAFFALPMEEKLKIKVNPFHRGYLPMKASTYSQEVKPNLNESFVAGLDLGPEDPDVKAGTPMHGPNQWPEGQPQIRVAFERYHTALNDLGHDLLRVFGEALGLGETFFAPHFRKPMPFMRAIHYPPQEPTRAENEFGIAPHTDYGFLTILAQDDVGGLQVKRRDGGWIDAPYIPGTFVVNIADMLMRWTNDRWVSTPHRVINTTGRERYSIAYFFDPTYHTLVETIAGQNAAEPSKYDPITWGDYLKMRFDKTYDYRKKA